MTRKEFRVIASNLQLDKNYAKLMGDEWLEGYAEAVQRIANGLALINERFDEERFYNWVIGDEK